MGCAQQLESSYYIPPRATCTVTHGITLNDTTNGAPNTLQNYTTGSFTPAANDLLLVFVGWTVATGTLTGSVVLSSSAGLTFTQSTVQSSSFHQITLFVANAVASNSAQTVTAGCTPTGGGTASGCNITVVRIAGLAKTGTSAIRQTRASSTTAGSTPSINSAFGAVLTNNPVIGSVVNFSNPAGVTPPATWTLLNDSGFASPTNGISTSGVNSGYTNSTITWGSTTATGSVNIFAELDNT